MPMPVPSTQDPSWTKEETGDLVVLWDEAEVQRQFEWGERSDTHIYEVLSVWMLECGQDQLAQQCRITVKALWAQWVVVINHDHWFSSSCKSMTFMQQLTAILEPWDPGFNLTVYSNTVSLPEPLPKPGTSSDASPEEGPLGIQYPVRLSSPAAVSTSSMGSPGQHLRCYLCSPRASHEVWLAMTPPATSSSSSSPGGWP
ncbi:hypothetical protein Y1Q_0021424 [Alligator mississippiensis]|uniref:Uncharacterized protein n=1 Tax=Alligator mississippiensis TaxID=8496 RepID=A0A151PAJ1_ALLMI|nr:hypothetical protein Y1Q_0021424 [Alligator mississippiensis]